MIGKRKLTNYFNLDKEFPDLQSQVLEIVIDLQNLVLQIFPDPETTFDGENIGYGFGSGYKDLVFVITPHSKHVNLGIVNGAVLEDHHVLMEGKGKVHQHVKLRKIEEVHDPNLEELMQRALQTAQEKIQLDA